jgi:hypothetical protein
MRWAHDAPTRSLRVSTVNQTATSQSIPRLASRHKPTPADDDDGDELSALEARSGRRQSRSRETGELGELFSGEQEKHPFRPLCERDDEKGEFQSMSTEATEGDNSLSFRRVALQPNVPFVAPCRGRLAVRVRLRGDVGHWHVYPIVNGVQLHHIELLHPHRGGGNDNGAWPNARTSDAFETATIAQNDKILITTGSNVGDDWVQQVDATLIFERELGECCFSCCCFFCYNCCWHYFTRFTDLKLKTT